MYNFIDTNQVQESVPLPSEALQLNGEYIENLIDGYRTLSVTGREALSPELSTYETGVRDGSSLKNKRFPARTIIVRYQLIAKSNEDFRAAYNQLGGILNVENAEMIFADEPDKFFRGTPALVGDVEPGRNAVVGEIEFFCADPFKYSIYEYEAEASLDDNSILIDYEGTHKSYPTLEASFFNETEVAEDGETAQTLTGGGECGYVAFFTEDEKIVQLGDPNEVDGENAFAKSQTQMNQTFLSSTSWGGTAQGLWAVNNGNVIDNRIGQAGNVAMAVASKSAEAGTTSKKLVGVTTATGGKTITYTATAKTYNRSASAVTVKVTISAKMSKGYLAKGCSLRAGIYAGGSWRRVYLKTVTALAWKAGKSYSNSVTFTVSGLNANSTALSGIRFMVERTDDFSTEGGEIPSMSCPNIPISTYTAGEALTYYLTPSSYGTGTAQWHGPSITRTFGADASGEVGATNFTLTYKQRLNISNTQAGQNETGMFQMALIASGGVVVAGIRIQKSAAGKSGNLIFFIDGKQVHSTPIDLHYNNEYFGSIESAVQTTTVTKIGENITFAVGGYKRSFVSEEMAEQKVLQVTFAFETYGSNTPLANNGLYWAKFVKNNCNTWREIPNKFSTGDIVQADCNTGEIFLNGIATPELGALGNDWEDFCLTPGLNQIGFSYSDWVAAGFEPTIKVKYREVFL